MASEHDSESKAAMMLRYEAQMDALRTEASALRTEVGRLTTELEIFKSRCYPTATDIRTSEITLGQALAWLAKKGYRPSETIKDMYSRPSEDGFADAWHYEPRSSDEVNVASLIATVSDCLDLPQWDVLDEIKAMPRAVQL